MSFEEALELPINQDPSPELLEQGGKVWRKWSPEVELVIFGYADGTRGEVVEKLPVYLNLTKEEFGRWIELDTRLAKMEGGETNE